MRRTPLAGLKCQHILPKTISSCLGTTSGLPYNWSDKLRGMVLGIALARSVLLQDIARTFGGLLKTVENDLSNFLTQKRLLLDEEHRRYVIATLRRLGKKRFRRYQGKVIMNVDASSYAKTRSRGKERPMPQTGKVRLHNLPTKEVVLAPGYQELWAGLLLKNGRCLGITRKLFTECMVGFFSQNLIEEQEIRRAIEIVEEALGCKVILVADRGFKRKELLHYLRRMDQVDFVIRIDGNLTVSTAGCKGLLQKLAPDWKSRVRMPWRDKSKRPLVSDVASGKVSVAMSRTTKLNLNVLYLQPIDSTLPPMFLATSLSIAEIKGLMMVVRLYSLRWSIETFFANFKESLRVAGFRVFSCWEAIDRLLIMAHMAFLALSLLYLMVESAPAQRRLMRSKLRSWFARPPEVTLGRFLKMIALDFTRHYWAAEAA